MTFLPLIFFFCIRASAAVLSWDASPSPDVVGYKIYYASNISMQGASAESVGNVTQTEKNFAEGFWFIGVSAVDANGLESELSNIVAFDNRPSKTFTQKSPTLTTLNFATNTAALNWLAPEADCQFILERSRDGTNWEAIDVADTTNKTADTFRFSPTLFRVRTVDASNEISDPSNVLTNRNFKRLIVR